MWLNLIPYGAFLENTNFVVLTIFESAFNDRLQCRKLTFKIVKPLL